MTIQQAIDLALQHHMAGRLPQAESIHQQILQSNPNQPVALHLLGVIACQTGVALLSRIGTPDDFNNDQGMGPRDGTKG